MVLFWYWYNAIKKVNINYLNMRYRLIWFSLDSKFA